MTTCQLSVCVCIKQHFRFSHFFIGDRTRPCGSRFFPSEEIHTHFSSWRSLCKYTSINICCVCCPRRWNPTNSIIITSGNIATSILLAYTHLWGRMVYWLTPRYTIKSWNDIRTKWNLRQMIFYAQNLLFASIDRRVLKNRSTKLVSFVYIFMAFSVRFGRIVWIYTPSGTPHHASTGDTLKY